MNYHIVIHDYRDLYYIYNADPTKINWRLGDEKKLRISHEATMQFLKLAYLAKTRAVACVNYTDQYVSLYTRLRGAIFHHVKSKPHHEYQVYYATPHAFRTPS